MGTVPSSANTGDPQLSALAAAFGVKPPLGGGRHWNLQFKQVADHLKWGPTLTFSFLYRPTHPHLPSLQPSPAQPAPPHLTLSQPTPTPESEQVADELPHALVMVDITIPGVKVVYANSAAERLVGYSQEEQVGRNCRYLQGKRTEAASVRAIVQGIRSATQTTVRITNYKKGGAIFSNVLTLHPVMDSTGVYRYSIGILSDGAQAATEGAGLEKLRAVLPTVFDVASQPPKFDANLQKVDVAAQRTQWRASMAKFTRLLWSIDYDSSLSYVLMQPAGQQAFGQWLQQNAPSDVAQLEVAVKTLMLQQMPPHEAGPHAMELVQQMTGQTAPSADAAMAALRTAAASAVSFLAAERFPKFVSSKACLPMVEHLLGSSADAMVRADASIWSKYTVSSGRCGRLCVKDSV